jgi:hypothetical protein
LNHEAAAHNTVRAAMVKEVGAEDFIAYVVKQTWRLVTAPKGLEFITSDCPLVVNSGDAEQRPVHWMTMSLSPVQLFVSFPASWEEPPPAFLELVALAHNFELITGESSRFLYSREPLRDGISVANHTVNFRTAAMNAFGRSRTER